MQRLLHLYMSPGPLGTQILFCHQVLLFSVVREKFEHHLNKDPPVQRLFLEAPARVLIGCGFRTTSVFKELAPPSQCPGKLKMCFHRQCFSSLQSSAGHVLNVGPSAPRGFLPWLVLFKSGSPECVLWLFPSIRQGGFAVQLVWKALG